MTKKFLNILLIVLLLSLGLQLLFPPTKPNTTQSEFPITLTTTKKSFAQHKTVELKITNNTNTNLRINSRCPHSPFNIYKVANNQNILKASTAALDCQTPNDSTLQNLVVRANSFHLFKFNYWSNELFNELGEYKISYQPLNSPEDSLEIFSNSFEIQPRGFFSKIWIGLLYQPIYNFLMFLVSIAPGQSLGLAIITLTLLIRLALYLPNQKALMSQKKIANIQPKLQEIKNKYKNNPQKLAEETMKIWKEHKVNPSSSCLPILLQFPILIALFYVINDGLNPDKKWLLYNSLQNLDYTQIQTFFAGFLNLTEKNLLLLPLTVGLLQFFQIKLSQPKTKAKTSTEQSMHAVMLYVMPGMIAIFTASLPAGVGLYWGTSTLFGIGQQLIVNAKEDKKNPPAISSKKQKEIIEIKPN